MKQKPLTREKRQGVFDKQEKSLASKGKLTPPVKSAGRFLKIITLGYINDRHGRSREINWPVFIVLGMLLPALSVVALWHISTSPFNLVAWLWFWGMFFVTLLGVTMYNHRHLTHRGYKIKHRSMEVVLASAAAMSWQGNSLDWTTDHRRHHGLADVIGVGKDPHSPLEYPGLRGLLWAQWFWLFFKIPRPVRRAGDLTSNPVVAWQAGKFGFPLLAALSLMLPWAAMGFDIDGLLIGGILRIAFLMTVTGFINSWCHVWGFRTQDSLGREYARDDARNSTVVALITGGEGNHNGHHGYPESVHHGYKAKPAPGVKPDRRWQPDLTYRMIQIGAFFGEFTDIKLPPKSFEFNELAVMPSENLREVHKLDNTFLSRRAARHDQRLIERYASQPSQP